MIFYIIRAQAGAYSDQWHWVLRRAFKTKEAAETYVAQMVADFKDREAAYRKAHTWSVTTVWGTRTICPGLPEFLTSHMREQWDPDFSMDYHECPDYEVSEVEVYA